jgi:hypothetical protein
MGRTRRAEEGRSYRHGMPGRARTTGWRLWAGLVVLAATAAGCGGGGVPGGGGTSSTATTLSNATGSLTVTLGSTTYELTVTSCTESGSTLHVGGTLQNGQAVSFDVPLVAGSVFSAVFAAANYVAVSGSYTSNGTTFTPTPHPWPPLGGVNGTFNCSATGDYLTFNNLMFGIPTGSTTLPSVPGVGGSTNLTFTGAVSDSITSASVVCLQESVATSAGEFFFDIGGTTAGGKPLVFSGKLPGYSGPGSYPAPPAGILFDYGGTPYTGVANFRPMSGGITIGAGGTSGSFSSLKIPAANPNVTADVIVNGSFSCTSYTTAT